MNIPSLVIGLAAGLFIGILACILYRNKKAKDDKEKIANAEEEALRIINDAIRSAESKKREATLEAKEEILRSRKEYEKEEKERRADLQKQERRLQQKEENIDRKTDAIEKKEEALAQKHAALDKENEEIKIIKRSQTEMLERISGFTADEAKKYLIEQVESEVTHETALKIKEIEARAKDEADQYAREIVASAIQRCAADHVAEITVSVVPLPNDEMKGRIIGREGRNIRTIETLTGVDLIIDDTPEAITVSCFEPVRTFDTDWYSDQRAPGKTKSAREHMEWVYDTCVEYAHNFGKKPANLLLFGRPGLGKTHLSAAIAREVSGKGFSVVYDTAGHIFERFEAQKFGRDEAERDVERVLNCDLLILDDLGTEMVTTFVQSALYQIINGRLLEKKSTIVSTNLMPEAIAQRYSGQIASRIEGEYQLLPFVGEDIRVLKKKRGL